MTYRKLINKIAKFPEENMGDFYQKRLDNLTKIKINKLVFRKNPNLFRVKSLTLAADIVKTLLDAHLSSSEETLFENWLKELAVFTSTLTDGGRKSEFKGIDLEFDREKIRYLVAIRLVPQWGNTAHLGKLKTNFKEAQKILRADHPKLIIQPVNGCCYGITSQPDQGEYLKYSGQEFWTFISKCPDLYEDLIEPIGKSAKEKNEDFQEKYAELLNSLTEAFIADFCQPSGTVDWEKILFYNSGSEPDSPVNGK